MPAIGHLLQPLEDILRHKFIPALTGRPPPSHVKCDLLGLLAGQGGIVIANPTKLPNIEYAASQMVCQPLSNHLMQRTTPLYIKEEQLIGKASNDSHKQQQLKLLSPSLKHAMILTQEKGAFTWLTAF